MEEFLKSIGIQVDGEITDDGEFVATLQDSNQYSKVFSALERSNDVIEVDTEDVFDLEKNTLFYESEKYEIDLSADLENDVYEITVREKID